MDKLTATATKALSELSKLGAVKAQCYIERLVRTELRIENGEPQMLRSIDEEQTILTAIDADNRMGTLTIPTTGEADVLAGVADCIAFMKATEADEDADIASLTENGCFTAGAVECDVEGMLKYAMNLREDDAKAPKIKHDDDFCTIISHFSKNSAIVNTNGVSLEQNLGWYAIGDTKIPDLSVNVKELNKFDKPYDSKKWAEVEAEPVGEKFTGTVLLVPYGFFHLWWLTRMCIANDFRLLGDGKIEDCIPWVAGEGKQMISDKLTIYEPLLDPGLAGIDRFTSEGYPTKNIDFFENGVVKGFPLSQHAAKKLGRECNAMPHEAMRSGRNVFVNAGDTPVADMLRNIKHGLILNSFHCCPQDNEGEMNGVIRDGLLIENGEITRKVSCMVTCNFFEMMNNVSAVSKELHFNGEFECPWIAFDGVHVS